MNQRDADYYARLQLIHAFFSRMQDRELRLCLYICEQCYTRGLDCVVITYPEFIRALGLSRAYVAIGIAEAHARGLLVKHPVPDAPQHIAYSVADPRAFCASHPDDVADLPLLHQFKVYTGATDTSIQAILAPAPSADQFTMYTGSESSAGQDLAPPVQSLYPSSHVGAPAPSYYPHNLGLIRSDPNQQDACLGSDGSRLASLASDPPGEIAQAPAREEDDPIAYEQAMDLDAVTRRALAELTDRPYDQMALSFVAPFREVITRRRKLLYERGYTVKTMAMRYRSALDKNAAKGDVRAASYKGFEDALLIELGEKVSVRLRDRLNPPPPRDSPPRGGRASGAPPPSATARIRRERDDDDLTVAPPDLRDSLTAAPPLARLA